MSVFESTARLDRRPEARAISVEDLLSEIGAGRIRIPEFQRALNWGDQDRIALFDSIYRGFPIGTLLFWKHPAEAARSYFGDFAVDAEGRTDALWIVDGQQRVTTLASVLLAGAGSNPAGRTIRFNLADKAFAYGTATQKPAPLWIPLSEVHDAVRLMAWASANQLTGPNQLTAFELGKRLREYQTTSYVVEAGEKVLRNIFDRMNTSGKQLKGEEVFDALFGAQSSQEPSSLHGIADLLLQLQFGRIESKLILRALLAVRRKDQARSFRQIPEVDVPAALADTAAALRNAIVFVKEAQFPHISLMPYRLPLVTLALFFHEHPEPAYRTRQLLTRWLWRGAVSGTHRGDTVSLRRTLDAVKGGDEVASVRSLLAEVGQRPTEDPALRPYRFRFARTKLQLIALGSLRPRDIQTGDSLDVARLCEQPEGPARRLSSTNSIPEAEGLANRILQARHGKTSLRRQLVQCEDEDILRSHLISSAAARALHQGDLARFLRHRELDLRVHVQRFLDDRAEWDPSDRDRPAIDTLVVAE